MASFLKNFKNLTKPFVDDDEYIEGDEEEIEEEEYEEEEPAEEAPRTGFGKRSAPKAKDSYREHDEPRRAPAPRTSRPEVRTYAPESYAEVKEIANNLLERRAVILNLEDTDEVTAGRLLDFLSGATFALNGQLTRIAKQVYAFAPAGVDFIGFSVEDNGEENDDLYI